MSDGQIEIQKMREALHSNKLENTELYSSLFRLFHSLGTASRLVGILKLQDLSDLVLERLSKRDPESSFVDTDIKNFDTLLSVAYDLISGVDADIPENFESISISHPAPALVGVSQKGRVMIIDDEPEILDIISSQLTDQKFEVFAFSDPDQALQKLHQIRPDVVLSDYQMPKKTGLDFLKEVKKTNQQLPVVFLSGYLNTDVLVEMLNLGAYGAIEKPMSPSRVISICSAAVKQYKSIKLLNQSMNHIVRYYSEIDSVLREQGKEDLRAQMNSSIEELLKHRESLHKKPFDS